MPYTLVIHLTNEDPVVGEVDEMPKPTDAIITVNNPRRRDGKDLQYLDSNVVQVIFPLGRVSFIEVLPSEAEEKIIGFVRE
jgi:gamma-glutamyl phosphate reductase